jgi:hypothetical protein
VPAGFIEPAAENLDADKEESLAPEVAQASSPAQALVLLPNAALGSRLGKQVVPGPCRAAPRPRAGRRQGFPFRVVISARDLPTFPPYAKLVVTKCGLSSI